jgi:hypothetical protein
MGLQALYPKPKTSQAAPGHKIYPYLLRGVEITQPHQVWSSDITYLPMQGGFMYLHPEGPRVIDWYSRYVLTWQLSNTLDGGVIMIELLIAGVILGWALYGLHVLNLHIPALEAIHKPLGTWLNEPGNYVRAGLWVVAFVITTAAWLSSSESVLGELRGEITGIAVTVIIIDELIGYRNELQRKQQIIEQMGNRVRDAAVEAIRLARKHGFTDEALLRVNLIEAQFEGADLRGVNLQEATLLGASLQRTNLSKANLQKANLLGADLTGANLWEADFQEANLRSINLSGGGPI